MIHDELSKREAPTAKLYNLREALSALEPEIHEFEKYVTKLFSYFGYETIWSPKPKPQGFCVEHEIDAVFRNNEKAIFVECKHHVKYHRFTGLAVPMVVCARFEDLQAGYKRGMRNSHEFDRAWIISNTKFSEHAKNYAKCKNIKLLGWNYPIDKSLQYYIETSRAYPLTLLDISQGYRLKLLNKNIITVRDFFHAKRRTLLSLGMPGGELEKSIKVAEMLLGDENKTE